VGFKVSSGFGLRSPGPLDGAGVATRLGGRRMGGVWASFDLSITFEVLRFLNAGRVVTGGGLKTRVGLGHSIAICGKGRRKPRPEGR
jgi:hypothetical protein